VRTRFSGVSRGTERVVATGAVPAQERPKMRAPFQAGEFPFPVKYGYAAVGRVVEGPAALRGCDVLVLHPHQTAFTVPADAAVPLPEAVPAGRAVLGPNMETALNALWDGAATAGQRIVVLGAGVVGCLIAYLAARLPGTTVTLVDPLASRAEVAAHLGTRFATPATAPSDADLVVEASGNPAALAHALDLAGFEATILVVGWYGSHAASLPLGGAFHTRRLRLLSSQVGVVAASQRPRWTARRRLELAVALLADPVLDRLIDSECSFARLPEVLPALLAGAGGGLCHRVAYSDDEV
jgi:threonine dehydrogenase-like Zn-dependent dehydrogenase